MQAKLLITFFIFGLIGQAFATFIEVGILANSRVATRRICRNTRLNETEQFRDYENEDNVISCSSNEVIKIVDAVFGLKDSRECPIKLPGEDFHVGTVCDEGIEAVKSVKQLCENKSKCRLNLRAMRLQVHCPNEAGQYLEVKYKCSGNRIKFHPFAGNTFGGRPGDSYLTRGLGSARRGRGRM